MRAEILSIGTEIVLGKIVDTNSAHLSSAFVELGAEVSHHVAVGDEVEAIRNAVDQALRRSEVTVVTGGLGPTRDDVTRDAVAAAMGVPLDLDEESLKAVRERFERLHIAWTENNRVQALFPRGASILPNPRGTARGFAIERDGHVLYCLPGVPSEMEPMFRDSVAPDVRRRFPLAGAIRMRSLHVVGMVESKVDEIVRDLMDPARNPTMAITVSGGVITLHLLARTARADEGDRLLDEMERDARARLGDRVYGRDGETLQAAVVRLLRESKQTLATAESCTGGLLAAAVTDVPGSSDVFLEGAVTYSNDAKARTLGLPVDLIRAHGAVSREVAAAMAEGAARRAGASIGVGITGVAGPGGGTAEKPVGLVFVALHAAGRTDVSELRLGGERERIRERATRIALDRVRCHVERSR
ncbi:MAG: competence/damage-inducible protein A [Planctomycetes bacterium]|nr:competence/damage-inducible protein A [Planctomycetota bacterium]